MTFWDTFEDANAVSNDTLGEPMMVGGMSVTGTVSGMMSQEDGAAPGGRRWLASGEIVVPPTVSPADGMPCVVRGVECRVESWDRLGADGYWLLRLGPVNRWSGEIPGV